MWLIKFKKCKISPYYVPVTHECSFPFLPLIPYKKDTI